jgi:hypothetical protein
VKHPGGDGWRTRPATRPSDVHAASVRPSARVVNKVRVTYQRRMRWRLTPPSLGRARRLWRDAEHFNPMLSIAIARSHDLLNYALDEPGKRTSEWSGTPKAGRHLIRERFTSSALGSESSSLGIFFAGGCPLHPLRHITQRPCGPSDGAPGETGGHSSPPLGPPRTRQAHPAKRRVRNTRANSGRGHFDVIQ